MIWLVVAMFGVGNLMNPNAHGTGGSPPASCSTSCITTEAGLNILTETGSILETES